MISFNEKYEKSMTHQKASAQARLPAEFKHINKRRKRNQQRFSQ